ncbi:MAG: hypothetical protein ABIP75_09185 [Pyrinomonadaceae bacterium]
MLRRINWPLWSGLILSVVAFVSYFTVFVQIPAMRNFPWANLILFGLAGVALIVGVRRAFAPDRPKPTRAKLAAGVAVFLSFIVVGMFVFTVFIMARWLPPSKGAPQVGQKAPEFALSDTTGKPVSLTELRTAPINGKAPKGVLLVFYRGYW